MVILTNSFAVFWKGKNHAQQFHADMFLYDPSETPKEVAERYARMFPQDTICSVRGKSGRFEAFKN